MEQLIDKDDLQIVIDSGIDRATKERFEGKEGGITTCWNQKYILASGQSI